MVHLEIWLTFGSFFSLTLQVCQGQVGCNVMHTFVQLYNNKILSNRKLLGQSQSRESQHMSV
jgi:hypothetical protein